LKKGEEESQWSFKRRWGQDVIQKIKRLANSPPKGRERPALV